MSQSYFFYKILNGMTTWISLINNINAIKMISKRILASLHHVVVTFSWKWSFGGGIILQILRRFSLVKNLHKFSYMILERSLRRFKIYINIYVHLSNASCSPRWRVAEPSVCKNPNIYDLALIKLDTLIVCIIECSLRPYIKINKCRFHSIYGGRRKKSQF